VDPVRFELTTSSMPFRKYQSLAGVFTENKRLRGRRFGRRGTLRGGQPDLVDVRRREVVDYKTNLGPQEAPDSVSDADARQMRLYAYLLQQNGVAIERGTIVRANGARSSIAISENDARIEADEARRTLEEFNRCVSAGGTFDSLARPNAEVCRWCPCLPMCEPFWQAAQREWCAVCGVQIEGVVLEVEESNLLGTLLVSLAVQVLAII
jgi:hypothetical protein